MKITRIVVIAAAAAVAVGVLAGCGGTTPAPVTQAPTTSSSTTAQSSTSSAASTTPTTSASTSAALVVTQSDIFHLHTTPDNYQAAITINWHPQQRITSASQIPDYCSEAIGDLNPSDPYKVVNMVSATLTATFTPVPGFPWPPYLSFNYNATGGSLMGRVECDTQDNHILNGINPVTGLYPSQPTVTQTWITYGTKTPSNPEGTPVFSMPGGGTPEHIGLRVPADLNVTCDEGAPPSHGQRYDDGQCISNSL
jgi:hypothetical protein